MQMKFRWGIFAQNSQVEVWELPSQSMSNLGSCTIHLSIQEWIAEEESHSRIMGEEMQVTAPPDPPPSLPRTDSDDDLLDRDLFDEDHFGGGLRNPLELYHEDNHFSAGNDTEVIVEGNR